MPVSIAIRRPSLLVPVIAALSTAVLCVPATPAHAADGAAGYAVTAATLGHINGQALACGAVAAVQESKRIMLEQAPRVGSIGTAFEQATREGYEGQLASKLPCPTDAQFHELLAGFGAAAAQAPAEPAAPAVNSRYMLMDARGHALSNEDFPGRYQLLAFGYASCADVCPMTLARMVQLQRGLGVDSTKLQLLFVTLDPARDTPERLSEYTRHFDPGIIGLSGPQAYIDSAANHFGVRYQSGAKGGDGAYSIDHASGMFLLGPDGSYLARFAIDADMDATQARLQSLIASTPGS